MAASISWRLFYSFLVSRFFLLKRKNTKGGCKAPANPRDKWVNGIVLQCTAFKYISNPSFLGVLRQWHWQPLHRDMDNCQLFSITNVQPNFTPAELECIIQMQFCWGLNQGTQKPQRALSLWHCHLILVASTQLDKHQNSRNGSIVTNPYAEFSCVTPWQSCSKYQATGNILCQKMNHKRSF